MVKGKDVAGGGGKKKRNCIDVFCEMMRVC